MTLRRIIAAIFLGPTGWAILPRRHDGEGTCSIDEFTEGDPHLPQKCIQLELSAPKIMELPPIPSLLSRLACG